MNENTALVSTGVGSSEPLPDSLLEAIIDGSLRRYIAANYPADAFRPVPRVRCLDGTTLSVQASEMHYCRPRDNRGPYHSVEIGYPDVLPPAAWEDYAEDPDTCDTVWAAVPVELVREYVALHGGEDVEWYRHALQKKLGDYYE